MWSAKYKVSFILVSIFVYKLLYSCIVVAKVLFSETLYPLQGTFIDALNGVTN